MGVNFPGGRFIAQVYRCSSRRLHTVIRVPWDTGTRPGASDGKSGMQLGETLGGYSIVKQKHLQKNKKNLTVQLVPRDFTKRIIPLTRTHSQAVE